MNLPVEANTDADAEADADANADVNDWVTTLALLDFVWRAKNESCQKTTKLTGWKMV